jgi:hypothetical protein
MCTARPDVYGGGAGICSIYLGELQCMAAAFAAVDGVEELVRGGLERAERRRRHRQGGVGPGGVAHDRRQQRSIDRSISGAGKFLRVLRPIPPRVCVSLSLSLPLPLPLLTKI